MEINAHGRLSYVKVITPNTLIAQGWDFGPPGCHCDRLSWANALTRCGNPSGSGLDGCTDGGSGPREMWRCIPGCGSCCRLDPALRSEAIKALSPQQRSTYLAMVGSDGWCIHFDTGGCRCRIYEERPDFCRISSLVGLFGDGVESADALAIACCKQQIRTEHGGRGRVMRRFQRAIRKPR